MIVILVVFIVLVLGLVLWVLNKYQILIVILWHVVCPVVGYLRERRTPSTWAGRESEVHWSCCPCIHSAPASSSRWPSPQSWWWSHWEGEERELSLPTQKYDAARKTHEPRLWELKPAVCAFSTANIYSIKRVSYLEMFLRIKRGPFTSQSIQWISSINSFIFDFLKSIHLQLWLQL